jgi:hypothetical protein
MNFIALGSYVALFFFLHSTLFWSDEISAVCKWAVKSFWRGISWLKDKC